MAKVYVVEGYEQYEPSWIVGVYATEQGAQKAVVRLSRGTEDELIYYGHREYVVKGDFGA